MSDVVIKVENLSKRYIISHKRHASDGLRHVLQEKALAPFRWMGSKRGRHQKPEDNGSVAGHSLPASEEFWALKDVSFEVKQGEVLGIIGRNGAGKSTLLKILSRITEPTSGKVTIDGRVASLLEVGTGFHPELTGRENIFLNGAILGMTRVEIMRKFDEIVAFSEVEKFLDTPVKRYSSGMYVRLAFAVAAHLEPEILIVDEVLAVGDAEFQKKCLGKMKDVAGHGRTVLFVSHSMAAITQLCSKSVNLDAGKVTFTGPVEQGVSKYLNIENRDAIWKVDTLHEDLRKIKKVFFTNVKLLNSDNRPSVDLDVNKPFRVKMFYEVPLEIQPVEIAIRILAFDGRPVFTSLLSDCCKDTLGSPKCGSYIAEVELPALFLMPGAYSLNVASHAAEGELYDMLSNIISFIIVDTGTRYSKYRNTNQIGVVMKDLLWKEKENNDCVRLK